MLGYAFLSNALHRAAVYNKYKYNCVCKYKYNCVYKYKYNYVYKYKYTNAGLSLSEQCTIPSYLQQIGKGIWCTRVYYIEIELKLFAIFQMYISVFQMYFSVFLMYISVFLVYHSSSNGCQSLEGASRSLQPLSQAIRSLAPNWLFFAISYSVFLHWNCIFEFYPKSI